MIQLPTPKTAQEAKRQADVWARAEGMFRTGGYSAYFCGNDVWGVYGPNGQAYSVTLREHPTCSCPDYGKHSDYCKHTLGLQAQLDYEAEIDAQCAAYTEEEDAAALMDAVATDAELRHCYGVAY
jgi:hypothetical protein